MPEITFGNESLKVAPAAPAGWTFAAGDTIIGTVVRLSPLVTPEASLTVFFRGLLKVLVSNDSRRGPGPSTNAGPTISPGHCTVEKPIFMPKEARLFEGPLHIQKCTESASWPFEIEIPSIPDYASKTQNQVTQLHEDLCRGPLPGSFVSLGRGETSCWIEYYLDAQLSYIHGGEKKICQSTHVIAVRNPVGPEFQEFGSQRQKFERTMQSYLLTPGLESQGLSFKQKKRHLFGSSKIPCFNYAVELVVPKTIPLNNPGSIPIEVRCLTLSNTSPEIKEFPPKVWLTGMKMFLSYTTSAWQDGGTLNFPCGWQQWEEDLGLEKALEDPRAKKLPIEVPVGDECEPIDLGQIYQLSLHSGGLKTGKRYLKRTIAIKPDFHAGYIKHTHVLSVEVTITIAGQTKPERVRWDWQVDII